MKLLRKQCHFQKIHFWHRTTAHLSLVFVCTHFSPFFSDPKLEETRQALLIKSVEFDASLIGLNMYEEAIKGLLIEKVVKKTTKSFSSASMLTSKVPHYPIFPSFELTALKAFCKNCTTNAMATSYIL